MPRCCNIHIILYSIGTRNDYMDRDGGSGLRVFANI